MKSRRLILPLALILLVMVSLSLSRNGLIDLYRMLNQMSAAHSRIALLEETNKELRRRLDLLERDPKHSRWTYIRSQIGWVRPGERLYLEPQAGRSRD